MPTRTFKDYTIELDDTKFQGVKTVFFVFTESANDNVQFDAWQFSEDAPDGISSVKNEQITVNDGHSYDLSGRRLRHANARHGIVIENGKKVIR